CPVLEHGASPAGEGAFEPLVGHWRGTTGTPWQMTKHAFARQSKIRRYIATHETDRARGGPRGCQRIGQHGGNGFSERTCHDNHPGNARASAENSTSRNRCS